MYLWLVFMPNPCSEAITVYDYNQYLEGFLGAARCPDI